jgi:hypothetical protein
VLPPPPEDRLYLKGIQLVEEDWVPNAHDGKEEVTKEVAISRAFPELSAEEQKKLSNQLSNIAMCKAEARQRLDRLQWREEGREEGGEEEE